VSAYSWAPLLPPRQPLFNEGASVINASYLGAERGHPQLHVMGVAKAALEASVRYLAAELGPRSRCAVNAHQCRADPHPGQAQRSAQFST